MKPANRKPFRNPLLQTALVTTVGVFGGSALHAEDLTFSGTGTVRLLASDWATYMPNTGTFNGDANGGGRLYWRDVGAGDGQYIHFDLTRLSGLTIGSDAAVTLQNANPTWGGSVTDSFIATANGVWTAANGAAIPGATAIAGATNPTGDYASGASVSWGIGSSTFQGYVDNAASFRGLAIIGGANSKLHFDAPLNPYLDVTTNAAMSGVVTVAGGGTWNSGNYSFTNGVLTINSSVAGGSSGAGAVTINSLGTVYVNGNSGDNHYWAIDSTTVNAGGVIVIEGHSHIHNLTLAGGELGGIRPNGTWGGWTLDDATTVTATSTLSAQQLNLDNGTFTVDSGSTLNMTGSIRSGSITKAGSGTMVLAGANGSSGGITINGGTLIASKSAQDDGIHTLGYGTLTINNGGTLRSTRNWSTSSEWNGNTVGAITVNQGGTWSVEGVGQTIKNGLYLNGGTITGSASHGDWGGLHLKSDITAGGNAVSSISVDTAINWTRTITVDGGSRLEYSGVIHNQYDTTAGINKAGAGTLVLSGANSYSGQTDIIAGTLVAAHSTALGPGGHNGGTMSWIRDGATLALQGGVSLDEHFHVWGSGVGGLGAVRSLGGDNALTNSPGGGAGYCLRSDTTVGVDADTLTVSGFYQDSGSFGLIKVGAGTLRLTAVSTHTGGTTVNQGTLRLDAYGGYGRIQGVLTVNAGGTVETAGDGTGLGYYDQLSSVAINGGTVTSAGTMHVWNITGGINMTGGTLQSNNGTSNPGGSQLEWNRTAVTTNASADTATIGGRIQIRNDNGYTGINFTVADGEAPTDLLVSAAITEASGGMGITKSGVGTMTLSGTNNYTGTTVVSAGTLLVNGALGNTAVSVDATGMIGGSGSIAGSLSFADGAKLVVNLADPIFISGAVTFGNFDFDDILGWDYAAAANGTYTLLAGDNVNLGSGIAHVGPANALDLGGGKSAYFQQGSLEVVVVPESGVVLLGTMGLLGLARRRRS